MRNIKRDIGRQRGFTHSGTTGENDQIAVLQTARDIIQTLKAG